MFGHYVNHRKQLDRNNAILIGCPISNSYLQLWNDSDNLNFPTLNYCNFIGSVKKASYLLILVCACVTELPLDYAFEPFNSSIGGFYPGSPKSLHM